MILKSIVLPLLCFLANIKCSYQVFQIYVTYTNSYFVWDLSKGTRFKRTQQVNQKIQHQNCFPREWTAREVTSASEKTLESKKDEQAEAGHVVLMALITQH